MKHVLPCVACLALCACASTSGEGGTSSADITKYFVPDGGDVGSPVPKDGQTVTGPDAGPGCTKDADCTGGQICDCLGVCVAPGVDGLGKCTQNKNCGSSNYCDTCAGVCRKLRALCETCEKSEQCDEGGACLDFLSGGRYCLKQCVAKSGCPQPGFDCAAVPNVSTKQCTPTSGKCVKPAVCSKDSECKFGEVCNQSKCGPGCTDDGGCATGTVCSAFRCVAKCDPATAPCATGQECKDGHCKLIGGCLEPKECEKPETYCDMDAHVCKPGCQTEFDCKQAAKTCKDGACVDKGCSGNFECAFGEVCALDTGKCKKAEGPYCEKDCDPQSDTACGGKPNMCIKLQDKDGKDVGAFCFVACAADPANACPVGYGCQPVKDDKGTVQGKICFRDCTVTPI